MWLLSPSKVKRVFQLCSNVILRRHWSDHHYKLWCLTLSLNSLSCILPLYEQFIYLPYRLKHDFFLMQELKNSRTMQENQIQQTMIMNWNITFNDIYTLQFRHSMSALACSGVPYYNMLGYASLIKPSDVSSRYVLIRRPPWPLAAAGYPW